MCVSSALNVLGHLLNHAKRAFSHVKELTYPRISQNTGLCLMENYRVPHWGASPMPDYCQIHWMHQFVPKESTQGYQT